jgi:hypothetical protein
MRKTLDEIERTLQHAIDSEHQDEWSGIPNALEDAEQMLADLRAAHALLARFAAVADATDGLDDDFEIRRIKLSSGDVTLTVGDMRAARALVRGDDHE